MAIVSTPSFTDERLLRLLSIEDEHFWFVGRRQLLKRLLNRFLGSGSPRVLDLGVGGGRICQQLAADGYRMTAVDFLPAGLSRLQREAPGVATVQSSGESLPLGDEVYDAALALDVLEHIDDEAAARELARVLRPGGLLFVTVPAFPFLWGVRDSEAGHRRRYRRQGLEQLLTGAGFTVEQSGYYQFWLFPLTMLSRLAGRQSARTRDMEDLPPAWINQLFLTINRWEVQWGETVAWPWGSSLYLVARKEEPVRVA